MIREIAWYLDDNRFARTAGELESAVRACAGAEKNSAGAARLREDARKLFERHCAQSGLRGQENSFININAEFFGGGKLDEAALEAFIKNIIKAYCYQKLLWTYMGTTESLSPVSKMEMRRQGLNWEDALPLSYKRSLPKSSRAFRTASHRFDMLADTSGVNWREGYDPDGGVTKDGWRGGFDAEGTWVRTDEKSAAAEPPPASAVLYIIRDKEAAILYDPAGVLLTPAGLVYLTDSGEIYGALDTDIRGTASEIRRSLAEMGVRYITEIGCPDAENPETVKAYRAVLQDLAAASLVLSGAETVRAKIADKQKLFRGAAAEEAGVKLEKTIRLCRGQPDLAAESLPALFPDISGVLSTEGVVPNAPPAGRVVTSEGSPPVLSAERVVTSEGSPPVLSAERVVTSEGSPPVLSAERVVTSEGSPPELSAERVVTSEGSPPELSAERVVTSEGSPPDYSLIIGGVTGIPLSEKGFNRSVLREKYGYGKDAARKAEQFLAGLRLREGLLPDTLAGILLAAET
ncbi:MAG: hypothetical protein LBQ57_09635, partial [Spirochaetales bacterium]|nr:hypothetical protein [Spirochaetales bacterium]